MEQVIELIIEVMDPTLDVFYFVWTYRLNHIRYDHSYYIQDYLTEHHCSYTDMVNVIRNFTGSFNSVVMDDFQGSFDKNVDYN